MDGACEYTNNANHLKMYLQRCPPQLFQGTDHKKSELGEGRKNCTIKQFHARENDRMDDHAKGKANNKIRAEGKVLLSTKYSLLFYTCSRSIFLTKYVLENAENSIYEPRDCKISGGACPQTPLQASASDAHPLVLLSQQLAKYFPYADGAKKIAYWILYKKRTIIFLNSLVTDQKSSICLNKNRAEGFARKKIRHTSNGPKKKK